MKKLLIVLTALVAVFVCKAQPVRETSPTSIVALMQRVMAGRNLYLPVVAAAPTQRPSLSAGGGVDSVGAEVYCTADSSVYIFKGGDRWEKQASKSYLLLNYYTKAQVDSIASHIDLTPYVKYSDSTVKYVTPTQADNTYVRIQTLPPTAGLSGGNNYELHSAGTFSATLSWSAGRQSATLTSAATANITSVSINSVSQSFSNPSPGSAATGNYGVTITWNSNITYTVTVTTADGKTATASTSFAFYPKNYYGYSSSSSPSSSDILATLGGSSYLSSSKATTPTVTLPANTTYYYVWYAYPSNMGDLTSIRDQAGNQVIGAFTKTVLSITNASGYTQNYNVYTSNNNYSNTSIYANYQ